MSAKTSQARPRDPEIYETEDKKISTSDLASVIIDKLSADQFAVIHAPSSQTPHPHPVAILPKKVNHPVFGAKKVNDQFATFMRKRVDMTNPTIAEIVTKDGIVKAGSKDWKDAEKALDVLNEIKLSRFTSDEQRDMAIIDLIKGIKT